VIASDEDTVIEFVTVVPAAESPMVTGTVTGGSDPPARPSLPEGVWVHDTFAPLVAEQFHPVPLGKPVSVTPAGSVSVTVTGSDSLAGLEASTPALIV
jgi:hypothetical protein